MKILSMIFIFLIIILCSYIVVLRTKLKKIIDEKNNINYNFVSFQNKMKKGVQITINDYNKFIYKDSSISFQKKNLVHQDLLHLEKDTGFNNM